MDFIQGLIQSLSSLIHKGKGDDEHKIAVSHEPVEDKKPKADANGEKEEIINGHLYVDGVDLGPVKSGSMSGEEDILHILKIPKNYTIPENIMLPSDLSNVKFRSEPNGFAKDDVADFYDIMVSSVNYYIELLNKRNDDVKNLAEYIDGLNNDIHDKEMEIQIQKTGLTVIADNDSNSENMNLSLKIRKLSAENKSLKARLSETEASKQVSELKKRYDEIQDQLAMEQYDNKQMNEKVADLTSRLHAMQENGGDNEVDFAEQIGSIRGNANDGPANDKKTEEAPQRTAPLAARRRLTAPDDPSHDTGDEPNASRKQVKMMPRRTLRRSIPKTTNDPGTVSIHDLERDDADQQAPQPSASLELKRANAARPSVATPSENPNNRKPKTSNIDNALSSLQDNLPDDDMNVFDGGEPFDEVTDQILNDKIDFD